MDSDMFRIITTWQSQTFPAATVQSKLAHLKEEIEEVLNGIKNGETVAHEFADCILLLYGAAEKSGMSYMDIKRALWQKMSININRKWGSPDEKGIVRHIEDLNGHHAKTFKTL